MKALLPFAHELADLARPIALRYFRGAALETQNKKAQGFDPVTIADREIETAIREHIQANRPQDGVLGEEFGTIDSQNGLTWVIDPIDGTRAYLAGAPTWGVLIALFDGTKPVLGIIDQPFTGERFIGAEDVAELIFAGGKTPLITRKDVALGDAVLFSTGPEYFADQEFTSFKRVVDAVKLRRYGLDCYAYGLLALGQVDLVIEAGLSAYDIQAPIAVIEAAGGLVTDWQGKPVYQGGQVLAAGSAALHEEALSLLNA